MRLLPCLHRGRFRNDRDRCSPRDLGAHRIAGRLSLVCRFPSCNGQWLAQAVARSNRPSYLHSFFARLSSLPVLPHQNNSGYKYLF